MPDKYIYTYGNGGIYDIPSYEKTHSLKNKYDTLSGLTIYEFYQESNLNYTTTYIAPGYTSLNHNGKLYTIDSPSSYSFSSGINDGNLGYWNGGRSLIHLGTSQNNFINIFDSTISDSSRVLYIDGGGQGFGIFPIYY